MNHPSEVRSRCWIVCDIFDGFSSSCHCVPNRFRPGNVRGALYLGFEEVSVVTTVS